MSVCLFVCVVSVEPLLDPVTKDASAPAPVEGLCSTPEVLVLLLEPELASEVEGAEKIDFFLSPKKTLV